MPLSRRRKVGLLCGPLLASVVIAIIVLAVIPEPQTFDTKVAPPFNEEACRLCGATNECSGMFSVSLNDQTWKYMTGAQFCGLNLCCCPMRSAPGGDHPSSEVRCSAASPQGTSTCTCEKERQLCAPRPCAPHFYINWLILAPCLILLVTISLCCMMCTKREPSLNANA